MVLVLHAPSLGLQVALPLLLLPLQLPLLLFVACCLLLVLF